MPAASPAIGYLLFFLGAALVAVGLAAGFLALAAGFLLAFLAGAFFEVSVEDFSSFLSPKISSQFGTPYFRMIGPLTVVSSKYFVPALNASALCANPQDIPERFEPRRAQDRTTFQGGSDIARLLEVVPLSTASQDVSDSRPTFGIARLYAIR